MCFPIQSAIFVVKRVFWKTWFVYQNRIFLWGKNLVFKQGFCCVLRSWYCLILKVLRVLHLEQLFCCCLLAFCQLRELLRQNVCRNCCMSHVCEFWLQLSRLSHFIYLDFSISRSCFLGCIPSVERWSSSVKYSFDFEHLQNDTDKSCARYRGAVLS